MKSKTWNIREYCQGGVITAEIHDNNHVIVMGKEWDQSKGWSTKSDQSNAKPFCYYEGNFLSYSTQMEFDVFLNDLTTFYYASQIMDWIKANL